MVMGAAYHKEELGFEFPELDVNFGDGKRVYQILGDKGRTVKTIMLPNFFNLSSHLAATETYDDLYSLN